METDREILCWFHQRIVHQYGESELVDFMHRLRWIIAATPAKRISRGEGIQHTCNSAKDLLKIIKPTPFEKALLSEQNNQ